MRIYFTIMGMGELPALRVDQDFGRCRTNSFRDWLELMEKSKVGA